MLMLHKETILLDKVEKTNKFLKVFQVGSA